VLGFYVHHNESYLCNTLYLYTTVTKRQTLPEYVSKKEDLFYQSKQIWEEILGLEKGIRLLGITVTNLDPMTYENIKLPLWEKSDRSLLL